jgi:hypothetical protein
VAAGSSPASPTRLINASDRAREGGGARAAERERPKAIAAAHRLVDDTVVITLATGVQVAIPRKLLQGLQGATPRQLAKVEIESSGTGLHWTLLDVDHYIPAILAGVLARAA